VAVVGAPVPLLSGTTGSPGRPAGVAVGLIGESVPLSKPLPPVIGASVPSPGLAVLAPVPVPFQEKSSSPWQSRPRQRTPCPLPRRPLPCSLPRCPLPCCLSLSPRRRRAREDSESAATLWTASSAAKLRSARNVRWPYLCVERTANQRAMRAQRVQFCE
jgi:hypothetical protein